MPTWTIENDGTTIALTYTDGEVTKPCGTGGVALEGDVLAWVADQAQPWSDAISTERGLFFKQAMPFGSN
jgi:hypothetical protein